MFCYILSGVKLGLEFIDGTFFTPACMGKVKLKRTKDTPEDVEQGTDIIQTSSFATSKDFGYLHLSKNQHFPKKK